MPGRRVAGCSEALGAMTVSQLRAKAQAAGVKLPSRATKAQLCAALETGSPKPRLPAAARKATPRRKPPKPLPKRPQPKTLPLYKSERLCDLSIKDTIAKTGCKTNWPDSDALVRRSRLLYESSAHDPWVKMTDSNKKLCNIVNRVAPSAQWIQAMDKYAMSTPERRQLVEGYTRYGDELVNHVLAGRTNEALTYLKSLNLSGHHLFSLTLSKKLTAKDLVAKYPGLLSDLKQRYDANAVKTRYNEAALRRLPAVFVDFIQNAPKLDKNIVVYRGLKSMSHLKPGTVFTTTQLMSTSLKLETAVEFSKGHYLMRIVVPKGTPCFAVTFGTFGTGENELVFPPGIKIYYSNCSKQEMNKLGFYAGGCVSRVTLTVCNGVVVK